MPKLYCAVLLITSTALPSLAFSQANISRPRTGSPVIPGGSAVPGGQSVPLPGAADPLPAPLQGLGIHAPAVRERRAAVATSEAARATEAARSDLGSIQMAAGGYGDLQDLIVSHLQINGLASIELNQFAAERTDASDVREFAEALVSDQQHFWRALERLGKADPTLEATAQTPGAVRNAAALGPRSSRQATSEAEPGNPTQLGRTLPIERQTRPVITDETILVNRTDRSISEWLTITDRTAQTQLSMAKELLSRNERDQFDQRFVAMLVSERLRTLAELRSVRDTGSDQFREIIQTAEELTLGHLVTAEALLSRLNER